MNPTEEITTEGQAAAGRIAENRAQRDQQSLQVSANSLVNPPRATNLTPPVLETPPQTGTANAVSNDLGEIITAQTQEASDLRARRSEFAELGNLGTLGDFRTQQLADLGVPDNVRQLKDIQLQLADVDTASDLTKTRIQGAAGQTLAGGQREVTQEDRENAVRRSGLAAQASVLQGNIQTATTLVNQAVQTAYQDRSLKNSNLLNQINDLSGTVDNQTQQLLDTEKARVEADQAAVKEVKDSVALAMQSGAATPQEVAQLTDINATDADRLSLAQSISARGATEDRSLDVQTQESKLATDALTRENLRSQIDERGQSGNTVGTVDGKPQSTVQASANGYADRLIESEVVIAQFGGQFTGQFAIGGSLTSSLQSSERQQFEQAKRNFINSVLRRESGAAIADSEFLSADLQYFPQRGDSDEVVIQKEANRNTVINNMYREANAFRPVNAGDVIESDGVKYQVGEDGQTLTPLD